MDVSRNGGEIAIRTAFSDEHDLVQVLCGLSSIPEKNCPVDFRLAALQRKGHPDIWHMDQVLAFCTDECPPLVIHGEDTGGNHGHPCAIRVHAPGHGKTVRDVGTLWRDASGLTFTLLRVESANALLFLSENTGPSVTEYAFADHVDGALTCVDSGEVLLPQSQQGRVQLTPAIRHTRREAMCLKDGQWLEIGGWMEGCDCAEIREDYEIINPATVARALREERPAGGYTQQPSLAVGDAMFLHRTVYRIEPDGAILCSFDHEALQNVPMTCCLGVMHQVKCDVYGGGVWRYMPKVRPFTAQGKAVDFTRPFLTTDATLPDYVPLTPDLWTDPASPPDRQIDFIRRTDGQMAAGFASGFLPVDDGAPDVRVRNITEAATIVSSCKTYPTFAGGMGSSRMSFPHLRGTAYKKYFLPGQGTTCYTVPHGGNTYLYMDFTSDAPQRMTHPLLPGETAECLEATVPWQADGQTLTAEAAMGYAVFRIHGAHKKG